MIELTGFQRDLLYALAGQDHPSGRDVRDALEEYYAADVVAARVYQNLDQLVDSGFVEKGDRNTRTNYYELTQAGVHALRERRSWEDRHLDVSALEADL